MKGGYLKRADMTPAQVECFDLLCDVFHGEHHAPEVRAFGRGIRGSVYAGQMATYDFNYLTRLVILAHDRCIRAELVAGAPGRVGVALFKRHGRPGDIMSSHPTIEKAIADCRGATPPTAAEGRP